MPYMETYKKSNKSRTDNETHNTDMEKIDSSKVNMKDDDNKNLLNDKNEDNYDEDEYDDDKYDEDDDQYDEDDDQYDEDEFGNYYDEEGSEYSGEEKNLDLLENSDHGELDTTEQQMAYYPEEQLSWASNGSLAISEQLNFSNSLENSNSTHVGPNSASTLFTTGCGLSMMCCLGLFVFFSVSILLPFVFRKLFTCSRRRKNGGKKNDYQQIEFKIDTNVVRLENGLNKK